MKKAIRVFPPNVDRSSRDNHVRPAVAATGVLGGFPAIPDLLVMFVPYAQYAEAADQAYPSAQLRGKVACLS